MLSVVIFKWSRPYSRITGSLREGSSEESQLSRHDTSDLKVQSNIRLLINCVIVAISFWPCRRKKACFYCIHSAKAKTSLAILAV